MCVEGGFVRKNMYGQRNSIETIYPKGKERRLSSSTQVKKEGVQRYHFFAHYRDPVN